MSVRSIDLNADVGELPSALADGSEERLVGVVTSINVACGGHAGDASSMEALVQLARKTDVALGAHPSYPDRDGFGRRSMATAPEALLRAIAEQVAALAAVAAAAAVPLRHIKPHGALYNDAARDREVASTIARACAPWRDRAALVGLAGSAALDVWRAAGFTVIGEAFADRRYEPDGTLRARRHADAQIVDPEEAARQAVAVARDGYVTAWDGTRVAVEAGTLCVHGDTPGALAIAQAVRAGLRAAAVEVAAVAVGRGADG